MSRRCTARHGDLTCCRLHGGNDTYTIPHPMPHLDPTGTQWDDHGIRRARGNDPWKGQIR
ncbi:hypothetical protein [Nocardioides sp. J54]|uniref:hypothetical protein n=1 Tax=Nocardioides sp. J54 TaxID=935866 RepID=UPI00048C7DA8|nr:hypothetical protein [Nocardioides sp. J54]